MSLIGFVAGVVALSLLAFAGIEHALHARATITSIEEQRLLPRLIAPIAYVALVVAEISIGVGGLALTGLGVSQSAMIVTLAAAALMYLVFTWYTAALLRWRPQAPCGCSTRRRAASRWTVLRSAVLAGMAGIALAAGSPTINWTSEPYRLLVSILMGAALATIIWLLPDAMPSDSRLGIS